MSDQASIIVNIPSQNTALPWYFHNQIAASHFHVEKTLGVGVLLQRKPHCLEEAGT
jgi:hypothetical protein